MNTMADNAMMTFVNQITAQTGAHKLKIKFPRNARETIDYISKVRTHLESYDIDDANKINIIFTTVPLPQRDIFVRWCKQQAEVYNNLSPPEPVDEEAKEDDAEHSDADEDSDEETDESFDEESDEESDEDLDLDPENVDAIRRELPWTAYKTAEDFYKWMMEAYPPPDNRSTMLEHVKGRRYPPNVSPQQMNDEILAALDRMNVAIELMNLNRQASDQLQPLQAHEKLDIMLDIFVKGHQRGNPAYWKKLPSINYNIHKTASKLTHNSVTWATWPSALKRIQDSAITRCQAGTDVFRTWTFTDAERSIFPPPQQQSRDSNEKKRRGNYSDPRSKKRRSNKCKWEDTPGGCTRPKCSFQHHSKEICYDYKAGLCHNKKCHRQHVGGGRSPSQPIWKTQRRNNNGNGRSKRNQNPNNRNWKNQNRNYRNGSSFRRDEPRTCFNCGEPGHVAKMCPKQASTYNPSKNPNNQIAQKELLAQSQRRSNNTSRVLSLVEEERDHWKAMYQTTMEAQDAADDMHPATHTAPRHAANGKASGQCVRRN